MWNKCRNSNANKSDRFLVLAIPVVLLLSVIAAAVFIYQVTTVTKITKAAELDSRQSDMISRADLSFKKPVVEQSTPENGQLKAEESKEKAQNTGLHEDIPSDKGEITPDKLEKDIRSIINNERGQYSIAYQNTGSKIRLTINPQKMQAASVIKLFVMIETYNQIKEGRIKENDQITLTSSMKVGGTGSLVGRKDGTVLTINQLISLMITQSDNTATNILIDRVTMDKINSTAKKLGCLDTVIERKMMDFKAQTKGKDNMTSVDDLCSILLKIYQNQCLGEKFDQKMIEVLKQQENNTKIPSLLPSDTVVAHKTGELDRVENDVGIIFSNHGAYVLCILSNEVEAFKARTIIAKVSKIVYDYSAH
ncbi:MAG: serine hydrolase [Bacillota bacterium]|nr:serine hydrolase [Bacillota bacterium]